jgi:L-amino acid N-acyltransferase YncA
MTTIQLRLAMESDLTAINEIYNHYVLSSTCTYQLEPESLDNRKIWFQEHRPDKYPVTVVELDGTIIGWGSLSRFRPRAAMAQTVEATVYVSHQYHRRGLGRLILSDLIERARQIGFHSMIGSVSADQAASIALQESLGFRRVAHLIEVGMKFGHQLDLLYLQLMLTAKTQLS